MIYNNYNVVQNIYERFALLGGEPSVRFSPRMLAIAVAIVDREIGIPVQSRARFGSDRRTKEGGGGRFDSLSKSAAGL